MINCKVDQENKAGARKLWPMGSCESLIHSHPGETRKIKAVEILTNACLQARNSQYLIKAFHERNIHKAVELLTNTSCNLTSD